MSLMQLDYSYTLRERPWQSSRAIGRLRARIEAQFPGIERVLDELAGLAPSLGGITADPTADPAAPHWRNEWLPALDGIAIYGLLARKNPRYYVEVGSGNSTRFAARAIADHGLRTKIVSIDPHPRAEIDALCHEVLRLPLEEVDPARFDGISGEDVVFADCSHRSFQNSDVTVFFLEILPVLPPGTVYGVHDVYLPHDYPRAWEERAYNEQYLLAAYLLGGADGDEILLPGVHVSWTPRLVRRLDPIWRQPSLADVPRFGNSFWLRRGGA